jgi:Rrf2 family transcriptional regulator, nitric oxide-sensitive transcriptional repressor
MKLTLFTDFSFRLLMQAAAFDPQLITIPQAAQSYNISRHHLTKIANEMVRGGFLSAVRGRNGGLKLARPAASINVADVVKYCESSAPLVECFDPKTNKCVITPHCALKTILFAAESAFYTVLAAHTLADLMAHDNELRKILS